MSDEHQLSEKERLLREATWQLGRSMGRVLEQAAGTVIGGGVLYVIGVMSGLLKSPLSAQDIWWNSTMFVLFGWALAVLIGWAFYSRPRRGLAVLVVWSVPILILAAIAQTWLRGPAGV